MDKTYTFTLETNDDDTGVWLKIEGEVQAETKRAASKLIRRAIETTLSCKTTPQFSFQEYLEVSE